ncbi:MAG: DUF4340 domain-containing protein [Desulfobacteraceae bacterium]|nr:DUF4340 domain-containing protein [Desulfobacteraceae bacterium]
MKKEYLILFAIIAALAAYLGLRSKDQTHFELPSPAPLESAKIDHLKFGKKDASIELEKKDEHWFIEPEGFPADTIKVKNMIKAAAELTITDLVSESGNYDRYELTGDKKITVQVSTGDKQKRTFDIGKTASTYQHTFVQLKDDDRVYHARGSLNRTFDITVDDLRDKIMLSFDKKSIQSIDLKKADKTLAVVLKELPAEKNPEKDKKQADSQEDSKDESAPVQPPKTEWTTSDGQEVDQKTIERLLTSFSNLKCDAFNDKMKKEDFKETDALWTVTFKNNQGNHSVWFFEEQEQKQDQLPGISSASDYAFFMPSSRMASIEKNVDKLLGIEEKKEKEKKEKPAKSPV